jgi:hypothetical protein
MSALGGVRIASATTGTDPAMIEGATNRLVETARQEQAQLFGRVPNSAKGEE